MENKGKDNEELCKEGSHVRGSLISKVNSPLTLGALSLLITEGILLYLMKGISNESYKHLYIILMIIIFILVIIAVLYAHSLEKRVIPGTGEVESPKYFKYDIFLAAPMAAIGDLEFKDFNAKIKEIQTLLKKACEFTVYYSGEDIKDHKDFDVHEVALKQDIEALKQSRIFVLIYPEKIVSSVLFEAGAAFMSGKPSIYFGKTENFPFLMKEAANLKHIKNFSIDNLDDVIKKIEKNKGKIFRFDS